MNDLEIGVRAAYTVGGLLVFGVFVVLALSLARKRKAKDPEAAPVKKVPLWVRLGTLFFIALALLVPAYLGDQPFAVVVALLVCQGLREFWDMLAAGGTLAHRRTGYLLGLLLVTGTFFCGTMGLAVGLLASTLVTLTVALFGGALETLPARAGGTLLGLLYVGASSSGLILLRHGDGGFGRILFFLMVIQLADVFGLVGGLAFGRRLLAPVLSPGKTWEGTLGSALAAMAGAALFAFGVPSLPLPAALGFGLVLFVAGLVGDLLASGFKRAVGLKDFGTLLPGHGGILDRFDGWIFAAPVGWGLFQLAAYLGY